MKLLLLADNEVGYRITDWLVRHYRADIALVVTTTDNRITALATEMRVPTVVFESDAQVASYLKTNGLVVDVGLVAWWPKLIREPLLSVASHGLINTHPSLLPYNRGKHYNFWALVEQAPFGVSLHMIDAAIDSGDIVAQSKIAYDWQDTGETLFLKARDAMLELVQQTYPTIRELQFSTRKQDFNRGSFHLAKELEPASEIDLNKQYTARELLNVLRARTFADHPACRFTDDGTEYEVRVDIRRKPA